jgi:hypothetical protein
MPVLAAQVGVVAVLCGVAVFDPAHC